MTDQKIIQSERLRRTRANDNSTEIFYVAPLSHKSDPSSNHSVPTRCVYRSIDQLADIPPRSCDRVCPIENSRPSRSRYVSDARTHASRTRDRDNRNCRLCCRGKVYGPLFAHRRRFRGNVPRAAFTSFTGPNFRSTKERLTGVFKSISG